MKTHLPMIVGLSCVTLFTARPCWGQTQEAAIVEQATAVVNQFMALPARSIPASMMAEAHGMAIIPNMVKGGFVVGVRHGRGVVLVRDAQGAWQPPEFITMTGGSVGWQAGVQSTDLILIFKTQKSVQNLLAGKFTIGADAAAAAGPVGRQAAAATDAELQAEILSWSRSRGLFAGVSVDGSALQIDHYANSVYYRTAAFTPAGTPLGEAARIPSTAIKLLETVAKYSQKPAVVSVSQPRSLEVIPTPTAVWPAVAPLTKLPKDADKLRDELAQQSLALYALLDANWKNYLALPAEIFAQGVEHPRPEAIVLALNRFNTVAANPRYRALTSRPEFQTTHQALQQYLASRQPSTATLNLPQPPGQAVTVPLPRY